MYYYKCIYVIIYYEISENKNSIDMYVKKLELNGKFLTSYFYKRKQLVYYFFSAILIGKEIIRIEFFQLSEKMATLGFELRMFDLNCQCSTD